MKLSKAMRKDPQQMKGMTSRFEGVLVRRFRTLKHDAAALLRRHVREYEADVETAAFALELEALVERSVYSPGAAAVEEYTEQAYRRGVKFSARMLRRARVDADTVLMPADRKALELLRTRNLSELRGITQEMGRQIVREVSAGVERGEGVVKLTKRINGRVDKVGIARARTLARTETSHAFNSAAKTRYRGLGITHVEWLAAIDDRTCDECIARDGKIYRIGEEPDMHPNCRCTLLPVTEE